MQDFDSDAFRSAEVAIEFTNPTAAYDNYLRAWKQGVKVVSGSTGWLSEHEADVRRACTQQGHTLFWASNFSLGVAIFSAVNKYLARIMNDYPAYDVSEVETHHVHKLDAPSGTAITLAEQVCECLDRKRGWVKGQVRQPDGTLEGTDQTPADLLRIDAVPYLWKELIVKQVIETQHSLLNILEVNLAKYVMLFLSFHQHLSK